mmetsp:Transcript_2958/g.4981  ORF Transcript_2958/g.4981 Transcript_2958/m.4981 type:complete len:207 (+) Transcript_2958:1093-1713(+)
MGLCGCITLLMPAAKKGMYASDFFASVPPVAARYASGGILPYTTDTLMPAFSNTLPPCKTRLMPPPPPGRVHASSRNSPPSSSLMDAQISSCAARIIFSNCARMLSLGVPSERSKVVGASVCISSASMAGFDVDVACTENLATERSWRACILSCLPPKALALDAHTARGAATLLARSALKLTPLANATFEADIIAAIFMLFRIERG